MRSPAQREIFRAFGFRNRKHAETVERRIDEILRAAADDYKSGRVRAGAALEKLDSEMEALLNTATNVEIARGTNHLLLPEELAALEGDFEASWEKMVKSARLRLFAAHAVYGNPILEALTDSTLENHVMQVSWRFNIGSSADGYGAVSPFSPILRDQIDTMRLLFAMEEIIHLQQFIREGMGKDAYVSDYFQTVLKKVGASQHRGITDSHFLARNINDFNRFSHWRRSDFPPGRIIGYSETDVVMRISELFGGARLPGWFYRVSGYIGRRELRDIYPPNFSFSGLVQKDP